SAPPAPPNASTVWCRSSVALSNMECFREDGRARPGFPAKSSRGRPDRGMARTADDRLKTTWVYFAAGRSEMPPRAFAPSNFHPRTLVHDPLQPSVRCLRISGRRQVRSQAASLRHATNTPSRVGTVMDFTHVTRGDRRGDSPGGQSWVQSGDLFALAFALPQRGLSKVAVCVRCSPLPTH